MPEKLTKPIPTPARKAKSSSKHYCVLSMGSLVQHAKHELTVSRRDEKLSLEELSGVRLKCIPPFFRTQWETSRKITSQFESNTSMLASIPLARPFRPVATPKGRLTRSPVTVAAGAKYKVIPSFARLFVFLDVVIGQVSVSILESYHQRGQPQCPGQLDGSKSTNRWLSLPTFLAT